VVERAYDQRPFADTRDLRRAFQEALFGASEEEQSHLIESYPDLGSASVSGGDEGAWSTQDQGTLGLTRLDDKSHTELAELTTRYRDRFGFPLVTCVRDRDSFDQILRQGWQRLDNSATQERAAALIEIARIAGYRFDDLVADANPIQSSHTFDLGR
jgi:OHCU decarboxylase